MKVSEIHLLRSPSEPHRQSFASLRRDIHFMIDSLRTKFPFGVLNISSAPCPEAGCRNVRKRGQLSSHMSPITFIHEPLPDPYSTTASCSQPSGHLAGVADRRKNAPACMSLWEPQDRTGKYLFVVGKIPWRIGCLPFPPPRIVIILQDSRLRLKFSPKQSAPLVGPDQSLTFNNIRSASHFTCTEAWLSCSTGGWLPGLSGRLPTHCLALARRWHPIQTGLIPHLVVSFPKH